MTEIDIQTRINKLEKKIQKLEQENKDKLKNISKLENAADETTLESNKWHKQLSDIFSVISSKASLTSPYSNFKEDYLNEINLLFSGSESNQISDVFNKIKNNIIKDTNKLEEEITLNKKQIHRYKKEINELRAQQKREV